MEAKHEQEPFEEDSKSTMFSFTFGNRAFDIKKSFVVDFSGFEEVRIGCCGTGRFEMGFLGCLKDNPFTCPDANRYVFWDSFHPSEKTNYIISDHLLKTCLAKFL